MNSAEYEYAWDKCNFGQFRANALEIMHRMNGTLDNEKKIARCDTSEVLSDISRLLSIIDCMSWELHKYSLLVKNDN